MDDRDSLKARYDGDGFVVVHKLIEHHTLSQIRAELDNIVHNTETLPLRLREKIFLERDHVKNNPQYYQSILTPNDCGNSVRQIEDLVLFNPIFVELICYPMLLDVLETLFESPEFSFNSMIGRPKAARVGNGISNGHYHRDTPFEEFTSVNTILAILCLDDMSGGNGATAFIRESHKVTDEEAKKPHWRDVERDKVNLTEEIVIKCPAGSGIFFNTKILHAAGHNRSDRPRYSILSEWVGPDVLPTSPVRHAYEGLKPRSKEQAYERQMRLTFPNIYTDNA